MTSAPDAASMTAFGDTPIEHHFVSTHGVSLHVVTAGPADGEPVILLHGFPDFWYTWKRQIPALASAGYRVVVPDLRGSNLSDKPDGIGSYTMDRHARDVVGLIEWLGRDDAAVVGHDIGAGVAWVCGMLEPQRVSRLVILNAPHPIVYTRYVRANIGQMLRSGYMMFFQLPALPEWTMRASQYNAMVSALRGSSRPGTFTDDDVAVYREAWARPGVLTAQLNWYRAAFRRGLPRFPSLRLTMPVKIVWGAKDRFLDVSLARASLEMCDDGDLTLIDEASHWVQHEEPERVNSLLLEYLAKE